MEAILEPTAFAVVADALDQGQRELFAARVERLRGLSHNTK